MMVRFDDLMDPNDREFLNQLQRKLDELEAPGRTGITPSEIELGMEFAMLRYLRADTALNVMAAGICKSVTHTLESGVNARTSLDTMAVGNAVQVVYGRAILETFMEDCTLLWCLRAEVRDLCLDGISASIAPTDLERANAKARRRARNLSRLSFPNQRVRALADEVELRVEVDREVLAAYRRSTALRVRLVHRQGVAHIGMGHDGLLAVRPLGADAAEVDTLDAPIPVTDEDIETAESANTRVAHAFYRGMRQELPADRQLYWDEVWDLLLDTLGETGED